MSCDNSVLRQGQCTTAGFAEALICRALASISEFLRVYIFQKEKKIDFFETHKLGGKHLGAPLI